MIKPFTRWTADTETAFLVALEVTGQARLAAKRIGRSLASAYKRRQRDALFAARWDQVINEQQLKAIAAQGEVKRPETRERLDGWTPLRQRAFLRALSETGGVKAACERIKISDSAVYKLRKRSPEFAQAFDKALARSAPMLEQIAYERAVEGWEEPIIVKGEVVGMRRRYSDALFRTLLTADLRARLAERVEIAKKTPVYKTATREETDATLNAVLDRLERVKRGRERLAAEERERTQRAGPFPQAGRSAD